MWSLNLIVVITIILLVIQNSVESKNSSFSTRIVGGKQANIGQFPYQVLLDVQVTKFSPVVIHDCGGSLISSDFVVTAAHCLYRPIEKLSSDGHWVEDESTYVIAYGVYVSLGITDRNYKGKFQKIYAPQENIIVHDNYDHHKLYNDIALIHLSKPAELNKYVQPIELPPPNIGSLVGEKAVASGWGKISDRKSIYPDILKYTTTTIISSEKCDRYTTKHITNMMLCTQNYNTGYGTCNGDSGGPLVYEDKKSGVKYLVGITSWGSNHCENNKPDVFTRVSSYMDWIENHLHVSNSS